jgi:hypothetical protein
VAEYRRRLCAGLKDADWYDPTNVEGSQMREACNLAAINDMIAFLHDNSNGIAILDSTNPTHVRRMNLMKKVS